MDQQKLPIFRFRITMPALYILHKESEALLPPISPYKDGVRVELRDAVRSTLEERVSLLPDCQISEGLVYSITMGFDGAGDQSVYGYRGNFSSNILIVTFTSQSITF